jgi:tetratricopeptide (TPR) repeat protein
VRASQTQPDDPGVLRDLGAAFYDKGLHDKALATFERARAHGEGDPKLHYAIGLALEAKRDHAAAIFAYREAVRLDPAFVAARHTLADALASFGEHDLAIAELESLLRFDRTNEAAAHNLEVLRAALDRMRAERLIGRPVAQVRASTLVQDGGLRDQGRVGDLVVLGTPYAEIYAAVAADDSVLSLFLTLLDPRHAAKASGTKLGVQIVDAAGSPRTADLATALGITFLREGLGVSGTTAATLWRRATSDPGSFVYAGVAISWTTLPRPTRPADVVHGLDLRPVGQPGQTSPMTQIG